MKQRKLEILLEKIRGFDAPDINLEQYPTPALLAAELLHFAFMNADLEDTVIDLGCGTGILAIGAKLLGAKKVIGIDIDPQALKVAADNACDLGVDVEFICMDVRDVKIQAHTTLMNPPFGAQSKGSDRPFLSTALKISGVVYSIHNSSSHGFIKKFIEPAHITDWYTAVFPLKRTFKFHKKDVERIEVELYRIESDKPEAFKKK